MHCLEIHPIKTYVHPRVIYYEYEWIIQIPYIYILRLQYLRLFQRNPRDIQLLQVARRTRTQPALKFYRAPRYAGEACWGCPMDIRLYQVVRRTRTQAALKLYKAPRYLGEACRECMCVTIDF